MDDKQKIEPVLEIQNLMKSFGENQILKGFSLELRKGENLVIMGKSGSGKSVMVKCLMGLLQPDSGVIKIMGKDISQLSQEEFNKVRTEVGFLFQGSALYDSMTVRENLEFPLRTYPEKLKIKDKLVQEALESVGLPHTIDLLPDELSGGMKRRVALARTIILKPNIIIYDEPTTGLDPITAKEIIGLMADIQVEYGTSSMIITHDVDCARVVSNRMILLIDGLNYIEGTFAEISTSKDKNIQAFFK